MRHTRRGFPFCVIRQIGDLHAVLVHRILRDSGHKDIARPAAAERGLVDRIADDQKMRVRLQKASYTRTGIIIADIDVSAVLVQLPIKGKHLQCGAVPERAGQE